MKNAIALFLTSLWLCFVSAQSASDVKIYEGNESIPTYKKGADETSPIFYTGRGVQGAAGHIYPYPAQTNLSDKLTTETYRMVYLENEYLKVSILPAFGGKLFSAIDKTNGHELFHRNSTVKPDLIGSLGAWISGGIEWCFPHHHRTTTLLPADYTMVKNADGSATVWIGETERDLGLRGVIGITLRPGRSYIEAVYRLSNTNDVTKNFLFWANVAITANEHFRTFWPPSQEIGVFHNNVDFVHWPVARTNYRGVEYASGVDLTWWKNHPDPVSFFFWQGKEGFIGGYDYSQKAGTVHVGDVYNNRTSKLWQFGPGLQGQNARRKLTDDGKAYVELMTGTFSNNQPDYTWFSPHSVKEAYNYWYPIRDIEIAKNSNLDASVTLQMRDDKTVFYGFNTTQPFKNATALLKYGDRVLENKTISIDPATPFTATCKSTEALDEYQVYIELRDSNGKQIISYTPYRHQYPDLPQTQKEPRPAQEIETVEDLYLAGRFVEQFSRPRLNPDDYYLEALKKSPDDYRVNIALGIRRVKQWRYAEAEKFLQKAADKLQVQYFQPKEGELFYYLALAQKGAGKNDDAYRNFFQATWYSEWFSSAYYQLALMESNRGDRAKALSFVQHAYSTNNNDASINILYSALLRKQNQQNKAAELIDKLLQFDPLNFAAIYEKELLQGRSSMAKWHQNMQDVENNYIDIAMYYINAGLFDDALSLLSSLANPTNPLTLYYLAWMYEKEGQSAKSVEMLALATRASFDYCFPFREHTQSILQYAVEKQPSDAVAYYLLGNLLYDKRPDDAIDAWQNALRINSKFPMVLRNLAFGAFHHEGNTDKSVDLIKRAIAEDSNHPRWYAELESYFDASRHDFKECLSIMENNIATVKMDVTAPQVLVKLYNLNGEYNKSIDLLSSHHFRTWEGGREIHNYFVDAHTLKALELISQNKPEAAIKELATAMLYPENLEVGKPLDDERNAMLYYFIGKAYQEMNQKRKAKESFTKSIESKSSGRYPDMNYYQAMSQIALGNAERGKKMLNELIERGENTLKRGIVGSGIAVEEAASQSKSFSNANHLMALGYKGLGERDKAIGLFRESLKAYSNHLWSKYYLNEKPN
jgi:tetratricopeptide (TPR) repeat protein